jgi:hypothetical protein
LKREREREKEKKERWEKDAHNVCVCVCTNETEETVQLNQKLEREIEKSKERVFNKQSLSL